MISAFIAVLVLSTCLAIAPPVRNGAESFDMLPTHEELSLLLPDNFNETNRKTRSGSATNTHSCHYVRSVPSKIRREFNLNSFYTRYTEAYGIPIVSSPGVPDASLQRACYITRFVFADIYAARNSYYSWFGRIAVIGKSVRTTQLPEYSFLASWWDQRARGFGAIPSAPVSSCEEENLLCYSSDRWWNSDIGIHEFSHGLHILGLTYAGLNFQNRLTSTYNSARSKGLWTRTYAATDVREYWAEGVTTYFNVQAYSAKPDGIHNQINTREKLKKYDRKLHDLIKSAFPCNNVYIKRCKDKSQARSLVQRLKMNYPKCTLEKKAGFTSAPRVTRKPVKECKDLSTNCAAWASSGYCSSSSYKAYMTINCKKSCHLC